MKTRRTQPSFGGFLGQPYLRAREGARIGALRAHHLVDHATQVRHLITRDGLPDLVLVADGALRRRRPHGGALRYAVLRRRAIVVDRRRQA
jgi:hypothetical protein